MRDLSTYPGTPFDLETIEELPCSRPLSVWFQIKHSNSFTVFRPKGSIYSAAASREDRLKYKHKPCRITPSPERKE